MSSQDSQMDRRGLDPAAVDRIWDAMHRQIAPIGGRASSPTTELADTIRLLEQADDAPPLTPGPMDAIWATVASATFGGLPVQSPLLDMPSEHAARGARSSVRAALRLLRHVIRQAGIGAIAGFLVGLLVLGGGGRLLMRVAALLSDASQQGALTENGNAVGTMTLDGTIGFIFFTGGMFGWLAGIVVMTVRPWLPANGPLRYLVTGAIGFAVAGPIVLEGGENGDYQRFGILGLNICLFTLLPFMFGISVLPVIDWLDRRISPNLPGISRSWWNVPKSSALILLAIPALQFIPSAFALEPIGLLVLLPVIRLLWPIWARHAGSSEVRRRREAIGVQVGRVALVIPCLMGLVLMAQAIGRMTT